MAQAKAIKKSAARLHVLMARDSQTALVIRRGPSKKVCTIGWDRRDDTFHLGQWLNGRIYERRSDLSPNGKYFIYFAMNAHWDSESKGAWTAISHVPYLKAVALYPKGNCWHGGGLFLSNDSFWLNDARQHSVLFETKAIKPASDYFPDAPVRNHECLSVYYPRLIRDGWNYIGKESGKGSPAVFEKQFDKNWILRKLAHSEIHKQQRKGVYYDTHVLVNIATGKHLPYPRWEWAEVDSGRLLWAEQGRLFSSQLSATKPVKVTELHDFNSYEFQRIEAPYENGKTNSGKDDGIA